MRYLNDATVRHYDLPLGLAYGLLPRVEVSAEFGGLIHEKEEAAGQRTSG